MADHRPPPLVSLPPTWWEEIAEALPLPWPREAVLADLRWWTTHGALPGVERLRRRWGWGQDAARAIVAGREWHDRGLPPPTRGIAASHAVRGKFAAFLRRTPRNDRKR